MTDINELKLIVAKNITELRKQADFTQIELAEKLNYSDKAVSKWERGESIPDVAVLKNIADLFGVTVDYLILDDHTEILQKKKKNNKRRIKNRGFITGISIVLVWLIATLVFVIVELVTKNVRGHWLSFVYAVPVSMIVWLVFNSMWFNRRRNFFIISMLMWTVLWSLYITLLTFGFNIWLVFVLGVPGQVIILLWSRIRSRPKD